MTYTNVYAKFCKIFNFCNDFAPNSVVYIIAMEVICIQQIPFRDSTIILHIEPNFLVETYAICHSALDTVLLMMPIIASLDVSSFT